jgi:hypothetical protein
MARLPWNLAYFDQVNLPEVVGPVQLPPGQVRVLDMPVKFAGQSDLRLPADIEQFRSVIQAAVDYEVSQFGDITDHYVYVTIDQKTVTAGLTGRRPGAHSDAYIERQGQQVDVTEKSADIVQHEVGKVSHTYIAYSNTPTEFFQARFPLQNADCDASLRTFDDIAESAPVVTYPCNTLLMMTPYVVHRCATVRRTGPRTFIKVSISTKQYARAGNTRNPLFEYDWSLAPRNQGQRNHPW